MIRKLVALLGLVIACGGIGLFVALGVYVWSLKTEVNRQTNTLAANANKAGDKADRAIEFVRDVIGKAERDLAAARNRTPEPTKPTSAFEMVLAKAASQRLAGSVDQAHGAVVTASDAVVVANAALQVFDADLESKRLFGVKTSQVDATKITLDNAARELRNAKEVLGGTPTPEQLNAVDNALAQARGFTDDLARVVDSVRDRVNTTHSMVDQWSWRIAIGTTLLSVLASVGQLFMARYFWRIVRGLPA
jgi:hydrogenase maturation protease